MGSAHGGSQFLETHARIGMGADRRVVVELHRRRGGPNVGPRERAASVLGGVALLAVAASREGWGRVVAGTGGTLLVARGLSGRCAVYRALGVNAQHAAPSESELTLTRAATVQAPLGVVRRFVEDPASLRALGLFEDVQALGPERWRVSARLPGLGRREWELALVEQGDQLEWRADAGAPFEHALRLVLAPAPSDRGVELSAVLCVVPPGGAAGRALARWLEGVTERALGYELARVKQILETGEAATTRGQPAGRRSAPQRMIQRLFATAEATA